MFAITVPFALAIRDKPEYAPSMVSLKDPEEPSMLINIVKVAKNCNFILLNIVFSLINGTFLSFGAVLSELFSPLGFTPSEISLIGAVTIIMGVFGSFATGWILQKTHKYKMMLIITTCGTAVGLLATAVTFPLDNKIAVACNVWAAGIFIVPSIPVCMNFASELTFPLEATSVQGIIMSSAQIAGFCISLLGTFTAEIHPLFCSMTFAMCVCISGLLSFFIKEDLRKTRYGKMGAHAFEVDQRRQDVSAFE